MSRAYAEEIVEEIDCLVQNPSLPLERVIDLEAWRIGCLGVDLQTATDTQKLRAFAHLCFGWGVGGRNAPTDKQLEVRTRLALDEICQLTATDTYKPYIKQLVRNARTAEEFKAWVEEYGKMPTRFGKRMRMSEDDVRTLLQSVAHEHGIESDWIHRRLSRNR